MESEKVSVNIKDDKLAAIDLLVEEGLFNNRSDFINEAIDSLIEKNKVTIEKIFELKSKTLNPNQWFIGLCSIDEEYLLDFKKQGIKLNLKGFGSLYLDKDISVELIKDSIDCISKKIKVHGNEKQLEIINSIRK